MESIYEMGSCFSLIFFYKYLLLHFFARFQNENNLFDAVVAREIVVANLNVHRVFLAEVESQFLNFLRPGCREEQSLPVRPNLANDFPNLGLEPHIYSCYNLNLYLACDQLHLRPNR